MTIEHEYDLTCNFHELACEPTATKEPRLIDRQCEDSPELSFLFSRINYEHRLPRKDDAKFQLATMRKLLEYLGNPHSSLAAIHIAGTKGKGSVAAMMEAILHRAGYRVGKYTSPHLESICERYSINCQTIGHDELNRTLRQVIECVNEIDAQAQSESELHPPTFFEISTAAALKWFADQKVDYAVLEVGLGGRLDSTNVCEPIVTAINNVSFDHTRQLGNNLGSIAREKAGIIKPGIPLVTGVDHPEALGEIKKIAAERDAPTYCWKYDFDVDRATKGDFTCKISGFPSHQYFDCFGCIDGSEFAIRNLSLDLRGRHQMQNAAIAVVISKIIASNSQAISENSIVEGISLASQAGRIEVVSNRPKVVLDVAHNVASATSLAQWIVDSNGAKSANATSILIFSSSRDKDIRGILSVLLPKFDKVVLTKFQLNPRACSIEKLGKIANEVANKLNLNLEIICQQDCRSAWNSSFKMTSKEHERQDFICIAGSVFLVAELRDLVYQHFKLKHNLQSAEN